jgi:hypothetical protein
VSAAPFDLPEYDAAFSRFFSQSMLVLAKAYSPLLSDIRVVEMPGTVGSRVRDRGGMDVRLDPAETSTELVWDLKAVRAGDYEKLYEAMYTGADGLADQLEGQLVKTVRKVTEGTGNVLNAGGRPFGFDVFYEALESIESSLDENDELVMPSIVMNPADVEKLRDLPPLTDEQRRKLDELKQRKKEEALARRRRRRLS